MIRQLLDSLLLALAGCAAAMAMLEAAEAPQQLPLVKADYPVCVTVKPGTLEPKRSGANLYPRQKDAA